jgi:hypothetical protein
MEHLGSVVEKGRKSSDLLSVFSCLCDHCGGCHDDGDLQTYREVPTPLLGNLSFLGVVLLNMTP